MSLILEALKKSERQRQVGTAPTLATPPMSRKRKRSLLPWLMAAIAVAAIAGWWMSRDVTPDATPPPDEIAAPPPIAATAKKAEVPMTTVAPPPAAVLPAAAPPPAPVMTENQRAKASALIAAAAPLNPSTSALPNPAVIEPVTATPPATGDVSAAQLAPAPAVVPPPAAAPPPSATASLPKLWELPYEKRKDIPALAMSLQVYSADPAQRFAIINDERHVEGDSLGESLKLQEITPDGLIVEYRGERFLFPRGGR